MALMIIRGVGLIQRVDETSIGVIDDAKASSEGGLTINHEYVDLRGFDPIVLKDALDFESQAFSRLEATNFSDDSIGTIDEEWLEAYIVPAVDFGIGSAVIALSALGCIPISSCRGASLGDGHRHPAPCVSFYPATASVGLIIDTARASGISIENNSDMLEIYSADLRKMHLFARNVLSHLETQPLTGQ